MHATRSCTLMRASISSSADSLPSRGYAKVSMPGGCDRGPAGRPAPAVLPPSGPRSRSTGDIIAKAPRKGLQGAS